jgi:predicted nucleotidyltransferase
MQMKSAKHIQDFLNAFVNWASAQEDLQGIALVGSYARDEARDDSDIDLVLLTEMMERYLENVKWIEQFGGVEKHQVEDYGKLISSRVWYESGVEVEYGITSPEWAALPLDAGTERVLRDGFMVLFERGNLLSQHAKHAS